jgi:hypothetical protein
MIAQAAPPSRQRQADHIPWWISDWLPDLESEIGMVLAFAAMVPMYRSPRR